MGNTVSHIGKKKRSKLLKAVKAGHAEAVKNILARDVNLAKTKTFVSRSTTLHLAAAQGQLECLKAIVTATLATEPNPANGGLTPRESLDKLINKRNMRYQTALILACRHGHTSCVSFLLEKGANLMHKDRDGTSCLLHAALYGHSDVVRVLLEYAERLPRGVLTRFINSRNISGFSALHYAVWYRHVDTVKVLLDYGASYVTCNERVFDDYVIAAIGSTPMHLAVMRNCREVVMLILEHYAELVVNRSMYDLMPYDPRRLKNVYGISPGHLSRLMNRRDMVDLLDCENTIYELFSPDVLARMKSKRQPQTLRELSSLVLHKKLLTDLDHIQEIRREEEKKKRKNKTRAGSLPAPLPELSPVGLRSAKSSHCPQNAASVALAQVYDWLPEQQHAAHRGGGGSCPTHNSRGEDVPSSTPLATACGPHHTVSAPLPPVHPSRDGLRCLRRSLSGAGGRPGSAEVPRGSLVTIIRRSLDGVERSDYVARVSFGVEASGDGCFHVDPELEGPHSHDLTHGISRLKREDGSLWVDDTTTKDEDHVGALLRGRLSDVMSIQSNGETCCVCFEAQVEVEINGCGHNMCVECCRKLVECAHKGQAPTCPFCRKMIGKFQNL